MDVADPLDRIAAELEAEKAPLTARRAQLEAEIADLLKREDRINAALVGLKTGRPTKPTATGPKPKAVHASRKTMDDVYALLAVDKRDGKEPKTIVEISDALGISRSNADNAVRQLRSEQRIRICGAAKSPGGPKTYGPMS